MCRVCEGCIFANHEPDKSSCMIFERAKPDEVFIEGKPCKFRRTREDTDKLIKEAGNG